VKYPQLTVNCYYQFWRNRKTGTGEGGRKDPISLHPASSNTYYTGG